MSNNKGNLGFGRDINEFLQELSPRVATLADDASSDDICFDDRIGIFVTEMAVRDNGIVKISVSVRGVAGSEEHRFSLLSRFVGELSLSIGEIDGEMLSSIEYFSDVTRAVSSARVSLDYADGSMRALERKLVLKGFSKDAARDAVAVLADEGYINESEIAQSRARVFIAERISLPKYP